MKNFLIFIFIVIILTACQTTVPTSPLLATKGAEITLAPDQTVSIVDTDLTIRFIDVANDQRCPSDIECSESGPVSVSLSVQVVDGEASEINLQTFTDYEGRAPSMQFEGIENSMVYEGYVIRLIGVSPYPSNLENPINDSEYRVTLVVSRE